MASPLAKQLEKILGSPVTGSRPMRGGDIADVSLLTLKNGRQVVAKRPRADQPDSTATEAMMLKYLGKNSKLPVPEVLYQAPGILVISHVAHKGTSDARKAAESAAFHIAALHGNVHKDKSKPYGFKCDTVIGPLAQQNRAHVNWVDFFAENRLQSMAQSCLNTYRFDAELMVRIQGLAARLPDLLPASPPASLLHGDIWAGNLLIDGDHVAGFIDPAISYGHNEMDLAFIDLMGGLDPVFFEAYHSFRAIEPGFREDRRLIYQLWPLLVHTRLFGSGYLAQVTGILDHFGA